jgi:hypothetical protein
MLNKFLKNFEENTFGVLVSGWGLICRERTDDFVLDNVEEKLKLVCLAEKFQGNDYHFQVVLFIQQIVHYFRDLSYLSQLLVDVLNT